MTNTIAGHSSQRFVVAIDFGTSHSGFAYSHKANESIIEALYSWDSAPHPYSKTLTALLYDSNQLPIAWGYAAQHRYLNMPQIQRSLYTLVTKFKLFLDESYDELPPENHNVIVLIGDFLKHMKEKISEVLTLKFGSSFSLDDVQWCLTVPAMWSDRAKHYTRKAAAFAGLIDDPLSNKLSIILEPEAAAIFVSTNIQGAIEKGDVFMIVDAGGGTVDLTVHQMRDEKTEKKFVEVTHGLGKSCGSTFVDDRFLEFFRSKIGEETYDKVKEERPSEIFNVLKHWEPVKRNFRAKDKDSIEALAIPNYMYKLMSDAKKTQLEEEQEGFDDCVHLHTKDMVSFFDPVVEEILALTDTMIQRSPLTVNKILCVGGFTESQYLIKRIREHHEKDMKVICPSDPGATVVKGAVHFGLHPDVIASRRSRLTYGLAVRGYWDESYPEHKRNWDIYQKVWMVEDKFDKLVEIGEEVKVDHTVERTYYPPAIWSQSIRLSLYATTSKFPRFVDEEGCFQQAEITIPLELKQEKNINDYPISIQVQFGATEITIKADNSRSGQQHHISVNYDTQKSAKSNPASSSVKNLKRNTLTDEMSNGSVDANQKRTRLN